mmetsp:Transcript_8930/g.13694  ORF Transcript_8930/g.13694 Transcript_8930/m.13694 type:complete len:110 (+) Transcript_8930:478-807(+)
MHKKNMVHRDIKPENILLSSQINLSVKLADFGFAQTFDPKEGLTDAFGTPFYMAPEMYLGNPHGTKADVWSVGMVLSILMTGKPPFPVKSKQQLLKFFTTCTDVKLDEK